MPRPDDFGVVEVVPQVDVVADVVLDWLERLCAIVDHRAGHVAHAVDDLVGVERLHARPAAEPAGLFVGEIKRRSQQDQVLQPIVGAQSGVDGADLARQHQPSMLNSLDFVNDLSLRTTRGRYSSV